MTSNKFTLDSKWISRNSPKIWTVDKVTEDQISFGSEIKSILNYPKDSPYLEEFKPLFVETSKFEVGKYYNHPFPNGSQHKLLCTFIGKQSVHFSDENELACSYLLNHPNSPICNITPWKELVKGEVICYVYEYFPLNESYKGILDELFKRPMTNFLFTEPNSRLTSRKVKLTIEEIE